MELTCLRRSARPVGRTNRRHSTLVCSYRTWTTHPIHLSGTDPTSHQISPDERVRDRRAWNSIWPIRAVTEQPSTPGAGQRYSAQKYSKSWSMYSSACKPILSYEQSVYVCRIFHWKLTSLFALISILVLTMFDPRKLENFKFLSFPARRLNVLRSSTLNSIST